MCLKFVVTLLVAAIIKQHNAVYAADISKNISKNITTTKPQNTNKSMEIISEDSPYVEQQEHAGRNKIKIIMLKNKGGNNGKNARKKVRVLQGKVNNNYAGKSEKFFFHKVGSQGQRVADKKFFGFVTKPTIGTGIGGANQAGGEISIALPKRVKHLNIEIIRRPGGGRGGGGGGGGNNKGGGGGGGGIRGTQPPSPSDTPVYPDYYNANPSEAPAPSGNPDYGLGSDYGAPPAQPALDSYDTEVLSLPPPPRNV